MTPSLRLLAIVSSRSALLGAHGKRQLLLLLEVVDLGRQIMPPQGDAEQELHPGHDPVAITDAQTRFDQMQLEAANVVGGGRVGRALQERRKSPATVDVAALRMGPELACRHVLVWGSYPSAQRISPQRFSAMTPKRLSCRTATTCGRLGTLRTENALVPKLLIRSSW